MLIEISIIDDLPYIFGLTGLLKEDQMLCCASAVYFSRKVESTIIAINNKKRKPQDIIRCIKTKFVEGLSVVTCACFHG